MKATETIIAREIDAGWVEGWGGLEVEGFSGLRVRGDGGTGCIEGWT